MELVGRHGGTHHGYFLPGQGASDRALALFSFPSLAAYEQYRSLFGADPDFIPVFLAQGTIDKIIRPDVTRDYMGKLCNAGSKVRLMMLPNIGHGRAAQASTMAAVNWMTDRFAGETPPPSDCRN